MVIGKKQIKIIILILFIVTILFIVLGIINKQKYNEYNEVDAKIVGFYTKRHGSGSSVERFIEYEYEVDEKKYNSSRRISGLGTIKNMEKLETIKYNPQNPEEIEDTYKTRATFGIASFFAICTILLSITTFKNKRI